MSICCYYFINHSSCSFIIMELMDCKSVTHLIKVFKKLKYTIPENLISYMILQTLKYPLIFI